MLPEKLMLIINPVAGRGRYKQHIADIVEIFSRGGYLVTIYMTQKAGDARTFARDYSHNYSLLVCCGGDGTLSETVSGLMQTENPKPIGYIPMGTANDVSNTLKLSRNPKKAAESILTGRQTPLDVGAFGDSFFTYIAAFGAFTEVSYKTPQTSKNALGHMAYLFEGAAHLTKLNAYRAVVEHDGASEEGEFIFGAVINSTSFAGLVKLNHDIVSIGDGLFEVMLIKNPKNFYETNAIIGGILTQNYHPEYVSFFQASNISFRFSEPVAWTRDGEDGGVVESITVKNKPGALSIIVPELKGNIQ